MNTPAGLSWSRVRRVAGSVSILSALLIGLLPVVAFAGPSNDNPNDPEYWEARYPNAVECYYHDGNHAHGYLSDNGKAVVLNEFKAEWPGDRWELLVVKSGNEPGNTGLAGQNVYELPESGKNYYGPLNGGGQQGEVSHWIVCKGEAPATTTSTTQPSTTSTTVEVTTTSSEATTTTTAPPVDYCDASNKPGGISLAAWLEQNGNPDCIDIEVSGSCGMVTGTISRNDTNWDTWAVAFEESPASYDLGNAEFGSMSFPEDYNGGSVDVAYYLVGPEADYGKISGEPNFWQQNALTISVDTDCEEPTTTTTVPETTTTSVEETTTTTEEETTTTTVEDTTTTTGVVPSRFVCDEETNEVVEITSDDPRYSDGKATAGEAQEDCVEVLPTVVTTTPDEVDDEELPFTGLDSDIMFAIAVLLFGLGAALLAMTRRVEDES